MTAGFWRALGRARQGPASLGATLVLILTAAGVAGAVGITLLLATVIVPSFNRLEQAGIARQVERTGAMLSDYAAAVEGAARDYGDSDASYALMATPAAAFPQGSVSPLAMSSLGVQGMAYIDARGRVVAASWLDARTQAERPAMRARLIAAIARSDLSRALGDGSAGSFYMKIGATVAAVGVAQVRRSDATGAARGYVVMARTLTSAQLGHALQVDAAIVPATGGLAVRTPNRAWSEVSVSVTDAGGRPVAAIRFGVKREVSLLGRRMLLLAAAGTTLLLLIVLVVLRRVIGRQVLAPLRRIEAHMQRVRASGSLSPLDEDARRDEIGALGRSFNAMLRQLGDLREQIEIQSFALGRTDSAVAVMHNVRNALTPVSTILSHGLAQAPPVERAMLDRAVAELSADDIPAARRRRLAAFVVAGVEAWAQGRDAMRGELAVGRDAMAHALEIIGQQQQRAHERPRLDECDVTEIIARNAAIARYSDLAAISFSFPTTPAYVLANSVILSQVIGNLFGNAAEAIAARGGDRGAITVTVDVVGERVEVRVRDDGEGFDAATQALLFQRGFSTRRHKSGGLGLHWCANSMTAMEGALRLESDGVGRGAVAVLTLPAADRLRVAA